ncbi:MAG: hypothetical protein HQM10_15695 [Candidatus Riflebacteria bacterium]|nr:hypothetical protein [Candidatus Riflebacteria bacterium]
MNKFKIIFLGIFVFFTSGFISVNYTSFGMTGSMEFFSVFALTFYSMYFFGGVIRKTAGEKFTRQMNRVELLLPAPDSMLPDTVEEIANPLEEKELLNFDLKTRLEKFILKTKARIILVAAENSAVKISNSVMKLTEGFCRDNYNICLLDCDFREPSLHRWFSRHNSRGFSNEVINHTSEKVDQEIDFGENCRKFSFLPTGAVPPDPGRFLKSVRTLRYIERLKSRHEIIFIKVPPLAEFSDAHAFESLIPGMIIFGSALSDNIYKNNFSFCIREAIAD